MTPFNTSIWRSRNSKCTCFGRSCGAFSSEAPTCPFNFHAVLGNRFNHSNTVNSCKHRCFYRRIVLPHCHKRTPQNSVSSPPSSPKQARSIGNNHTPPPQKQSKLKVLFSAMVYDLSEPKKAANRRQSPNLTGDVHHGFAGVVRGL